ncbi:MAG: CoA transferase [Actinomycetia bacterium]|nr:CoA transferase [Actinomycetes bacterium]
MSQALGGVRVLDLGDRSAALGGRILADLGAEVIMVEPPDGNSIRHLAPFLDDEPGVEQSFAHQYLNANKSSVVLDLRTDDDQARFRSLVASADVIIDTATPAQRQRYGLDHDRFRAINRNLIQVSVTPFGLDGEWAGHKANDLVAGAAGGLVWLSGEPQSIPVQGAADPSYTMAGLSTASAVMIALTGQWRQNHPHGTHIDISLQEATVMAAMQTASPTHWTWHQRIPRRPGLSNAIRCADGGHVGLLVRPDRFDAFLAWCDDVGIDHSMTSDDWEWSLLTAPRDNNPVSAAVLALADAVGRDKFVAGALRADLVCLPVLGFDDLGETEQYMVNDQFLTVHHPDLDRDLGFVRSPADAMADGVELRPAPLLGQHCSLLDSLELPPTPVPDKTATRGRPAVPDPSQALAGVRIVDFGWVLAAPIGTRLLASFGAEVIRVESSAKPDSMRNQLGPDGKGDPDLGGLFNTVNAGKKSLAVDLSTDDGMAVVKDLISTADAVVNNFRPGAMDRMGLGYEVLCLLKPDIVLLNLPGAHRKGPWAVRSSMGNILMAASGFNLMTGFEGERPRGMGVAYPDFTSPHLLASTLLAALHQREETGCGQELHLTQLSGMVSILGAEWMEYVATEVQPPRKANRDPNYCPHGVYPSLVTDNGSEPPLSDDEWVAIAVANDKEWASLCRLMGAPDLIDDPRFIDHQARKNHENAVDDLVRDWTSQVDKWTCADQCQTARIAAAPVEHLADTYGRDPQLRHHYQIVNQPSAPSVDIPIDRETAQWRGRDHRLIRAPGMGEHNEYVVREVLGYSEEQYIQLLLDGILG